MKREQREKKRRQQHTEYRKCEAKQRYSDSFQFENQIQLFQFSWKIESTVLQNELRK